MVLPGGGADLGSAHGSVRIDSDTRGIDKAAAAFTKLEGRAKSTQQKLDSFSLKAGLMGIGIGAGVAVAARSFISFEARMNAVRAVAGATEEQFKSLTEEALRIGQETAFSASEAAGALEELSKAGVSVETILNGAADGAVALAAAAGIGIPEAAAVMANALNQFGLAGDQATRVADVFANVANKSASDALSFGAALANVGTRAKALNIPLEDVAAAVAAMADQGLSGAEAGTALNAMLTELIAPSEQSKEAMKAMGIEIENSEGQFVGLTSIIEQVAKATENMTDVQRQSALAQLFGQRGYRAIGALLNTQTKELQDAGKGWEDYQAAMGEAGTAQDAAETRMAGLSGAMEELSGSIETAQIQFGEKLAPAIRFVAETLTEAVNAIGALPDPIQSVIAFAAAGTAGVLLLAAAGAKVISIGIATQATWQKVATSFGQTAAAANTAAASTSRLGTAAAVANAKATPLLGTMGRLARIGTIGIVVAVAGLETLDIIRNARAQGVSDAEEWGVDISEAVGSGFEKAGAGGIAGHIEDNVEEARKNMSAREITLQWGLELKPGSQGVVDEALEGAFRAIPGGKLIPDSWIPDVDHANDEIQGLGVTIQEVQALAKERGITFDEELLSLADAAGIATPEIEAYRTAQEEAKKATAESADETERAVAAAAGLSEEQYEVGKAAGLSIEEIVAQAQATEEAAKAAEEYNKQLAQVTEESLNAIRGIEDIAPGLDGMQKGFVSADSSAEDLILTMEDLGHVSLTESGREALQLSEALNEVEENIAGVENAISNNQEDLGMWQGRLGLVTDVLGGNTEELSRWITMLQNGEVTQEQFNAAIEGGTLGPFQKLDALLAQGRISQEQYNKARSSGVWLIERSAGGLQDEGAELVQNIIDLAAYAAAHDDAAGAVDGLSESQRQLIAATKADSSKEFLNTLQLLKSVGASDEFVHQFIVDSSQADPVVAGLIEDMGLLESPHDIDLTWSNANDVIDDLGGAAETLVSLDGKTVTVIVDTEDQALEFAEQNADLLDGKEVTFTIQGDDGPYQIKLADLQAEQPSVDVAINPVMPPNPNIGFTTVDGDEVAPHPPPVPITATDETGPAVQSAKDNIATIPPSAEVAGAATGEAFAGGITTATPGIQTSVQAIQNAVNGQLSLIAQGTHAYGQNAGYNFGAAFVNAIAGFGPLAYSQGFAVAFNALAGAKAALGIASPSRAGDEIAKNFGGTFIDSLAAQKREAAAAGTAFIQGLTSSMQATPAWRSMETNSAASLGSLGASSRPGEVFGGNQSNINIPITVTGVSDPEAAATLVQEKLYMTLSQLDAGGAVVA